MIYIIWLFLSLGSFAQNNVLFEQGNTLYNAGKYAEAIDKYETILETNVQSSDLYFNLANAHYKLDNIAPSIFYYEKALLLNPNDSDIAHNLAFAKNMTVDAIDDIPDAGFSKLVKSITNITSFNTWAKFSIAFAIGFVVLFLSYYFAHATLKKRLAFIVSLTCLFLMCVTLVLAFNKQSLDKRNNPAIVFAQESQVKSEPNNRSEEVFRLHEGTKAQVLDTVSNWKKIKLADGKTGWIPSDDIKMLNNF
ncbi:tetratricopeptide repeat protein [Changchengzhania lutea]|uniref:tetratricopeptide repeat protein n=1 Tax=Changchengzhania lutea TaxID=2049305 RepID=UPI00293914B8|nr:tetratricopeptide repeat protein [Changchengzhania lutea]